MTYLKRQKTYIFFLIFLCASYNLYFIFLVPNADCAYLAYLDLLLFVCMLTHIGIDYFRWKKVKNQKEFVKYFEENQISYEVIDSKTIHVYGKYNLSQLIMDLSKKNLVAEEVHEQEESLENYYMNLIGGSKND